MWPRCFSCICSCQNVMCNKLLCTDGVINASFNALDRHVRDGKGDSTALAYHSTVGGNSRRICESYRHPLWYGSKPLLQPPLLMCGHSVANITNLFNLFQIRLSHCRSVQGFACRCKIFCRHTGGRLGGKTRRPCPVGFMTCSLSVCFCLKKLTLCDPYIKQSHVFLGGLIHTSTVFICLWFLKQPLPC